MDITPTTLTRAAALSAAAAGAIFVGVQVGHPPMEAASVATTEWVVRSSAKAVMAGLAPAGVTGIYLRQRSRVGLLGLVGLLLLAVGYLAMLSVEVIAAGVLPTIVTTDPGYVDGVLVAAAGGTPVGDIGGLQTVLNLSGIGYLGGGLLLGIATFRAGVLSRWAGLLMAAGALGTAALAVLPEAFNRPMALPFGIALVWLGISLWRNASEGASADRAAAAPQVEAVAP